VARKLAENDQLTSPRPLGSRPQENESLVASDKQANSRRGAESHQEMAPSNEILRENPLAAEPL
jgi:hypothetical protein